jgi:8-oxo-dGTP pyrophosphatase MutT (NUDIX family)
MVSLLLIIKNNQFILFKRPNGQYGLCGGHSENNETPVETLVREVKEEIGVDIYNFRFLKRYDTDNIINLFYIVDDRFDEQNIRLNDEHTEWKYFTYYEILHNKEIMSTTKDFVNAFLKTL